LKSVNQVLEGTKLKESRLISDDECRHCRGSGWAHKTGVQGQRPFTYVERCGCWMKVRSQSFAESLPSELQKMTLESYDFRRVESREVFKQLFLSPGRGYLLTGPYGAGKTHLLVGLYLKACISDTKMVFCSARRLVTWLQEEAMRKPGDDHVRIMDLAKSREPFHLFWDDIDKLKVTDSRREMLFDLLDSMVANGHKISASSNLQLEKLAGSSFFRGDLIRRLEVMTDEEIILMPRK